MTTSLLLLPTPRHLAIAEERYTLPEIGLIALDSSDVQALRFSAARLQAALRQHAERNWDIVAGTAAPADQIGITVTVVPGATRHPQGYELTITPGGIFAVASTPAGAFYAVTTLIQILEQGGPTLPILRISDWPDFPNRGLMLDVSRDKVPTMDTLYGLVDMLATWKINQIQLYTEHTFAYRNHPEVWAEASPITGREILALDAYCRERFIELVPNQNSFGHMHRWLKHDRYLSLAEAPDGFTNPWGTHMGPFSLNPTDTDSLNLLRDMYDELLPHFSSVQFNVGCDETWDVGQGKSKTLVAEQGAGRVYLDFLLKIYREVKGRGRTMQFWGDIIIQYPGLVAELPRDVIALEWGYEADHPFAEHGAIFAASGVPFYVCPGTSSWRTIAGRTDNALGNLRNAAENGLKHGAVGYLSTDWGDSGHWQPLPVSYLGFAYGAAVSWTCQASQEIDIAAATGRYAFADPAGTMGRLAYDLGNTYQKPGVRIPNSNVLFNIMQLSYDEAMAHFNEHQINLHEEGLQETLAYIDQVMSGLAPAEMNRPDAELIRREFAWTADMMRHGCRRGIWMLQKAAGQTEDALTRSLAEDADQLIARHRDIWLARNRPGGLKDSVAHLEKMRQDYT